MRYLTNNCFWLLVPVLFLNIAFAGALPDAYQPEVFWQDIPLWISGPENFLRLVAMVLPAFMPMGTQQTRQRWGWVVYGVGMLIYCASWAALILFPGAEWGHGAIGFTAPAWTPTLLFIGIALIGGPLFFRQIRLTPWPYLLISTGFLLAHFAHAFLVFSRLR